MRKVKLKKIKNIATFEEAITTLPGMTLYEKYDDENKDVDILKVCCWICEKSLNNGISIINTDNLKLSDQSVDETINDFSAEKCLLVCGDCEAGFKQSLEKLKQLPKEQSFIYDPESNEPLVNNLARKHFIFPTSEECCNPFTYSKDVVWVKQISIEEHGDSLEEDEEMSSEENKVVQKNSMSSSDNKMIDDTFSDDESTGLEAETIADEEVILSETVESYILVKPAKNLSKQLRIRAQNTINLFCLNGRSFLAGRQLPTIEYIGQTTAYNDLRLVARKAAYKQAKKALNQVKMLKASQISNDLLEILIQQYQILLELTGFFSTWQQVFNDGGSSDTFNKIAPIVPALLLDEDIDISDSEEKIREPAPLELPNEGRSGTHSRYKGQNTKKRSTRSRRVYGESIKIEDRIFEVLKGKIRQIILEAMSNEEDQNVEVFDNKSESKKRKRENSDYSERSAKRLKTKGKLTFDKPYELLIFKICALFEDEYAKVKDTTQQNNDFNNTDIEGKLIEMLNEIPIHFRKIICDEIINVFRTYLF